MTDPLYISVDVEVTDTDPVHGRLMQIGMVSSSGAELEVIFGVSNEALVSEWTRENLPELLQDCWERKSRHRHLPPIIIGGKCIDADFAGQVRGIHAWVSREQLGVGHGDVMEIPGGVHSLRPAVFVAYCGGLDWGFMSRAFAHCGVENPFHYEFVEISSLAMGKLGLPWSFPESELEKALGLSSMPDGIKHNALEDARHQLREFQALMAL